LSESFATSNPYDVKDFGTRFHGLGQIYLVAIFI